MVKITEFNESILREKVNGKNGFYSRNFATTFIINLFWARLDHLDSFNCSNLMPQQQHHWQQQQQHLQQQPIWKVNANYLKIDLKVASDISAKVFQSKRIFLWKVIIFSLARRKYQLRGSSTMRFKMIVRILKFYWIFKNIWNSLCVLIFVLKT